MSRFFVSSWFKSENKTFIPEMFMPSPSVMKNWLNCFDSRAHSALCKVSKQFQLHSKVFLIYLSYNDSVIHSAFNWWSRIISWGVFLLNEPKIPVQGELALPLMAPHCTIWKDRWRTSAALETHNSCVRQCQGHLAPSNITHSVEAEQNLSVFMQRLLLLKI